MIKLVTVGFLLILVGYAYGRYAQPAKEVVRVVTETKTVEVVHHDIKTVTHEVSKPDGTKTIDTVSTDVSKDTINVDAQSSTKTTIDNRGQWILSGQFSPKSTAVGYLYGGSLQRRIIGPAFGGVFINTNRDIGLTLSLEF